MTPVDPLVVVTSEDLDASEHPSEHVEWVWPEDLDNHVSQWAIEWTDAEDNQTGLRFL